MSCESWIPLLLTSTIVAIIFYAEGRCAAHFFQFLSVSFSNFSGIVVDNNNTSVGTHPVMDIFGVAWPTQYKIISRSASPPEEI
jgi:hypothetical protein